MCAGSKKEQRVGNRPVSQGGHHSSTVTRVIVDYPSNYHNGAGGFSFADGHAEIHRWLDARTKAKYRRDVHLTLWPSNPSPDNRDVLWLQERAAGKK